MIVVNFALVKKKDLIPKSTIKLNYSLELKKKQICLITFISYDIIFSFSHLTIKGNKKPHNLLLWYN